MLVLLLEKVSKTISIIVTPTPTQPPIRYKMGLEAIGCNPFFSKSCFLLTSSCWRCTPSSLIPRWSLSGSQNTRGSWPSQFHSQCRWSRWLLGWNRWRVSRTFKCWSALWRFYQLDVPKSKPTWICMFHCHVQERGRSLPFFRRYDVHQDWWRMGQRWCHLVNIHWPGKVYFLTMQIDTPSPLAP